MDDAARVGGGERVGDAAQHRQRLREGQPSLGRDHVVERAPLHVLEDERQLLALVDDGVERHDVGVAQRGDELGFGDEAPAQPLVEAQLVAHALDRDPALELEVDALEDRAHAALADAAGDRELSAEEPLPRGRLRRTRRLAALLARQAEQAEAQQQPAGRGAADDLVRPAQDAASGSDGGARADVGEEQAHVAVAGELQGRLVEVRVARVLGARLAQLLERPGTVRQAVARYRIHIVRVGPARAGLERGAAGDERLLVAPALVEREHAGVVRHAVAGVELEAAGAGLQRLLDLEATGLREAEQAVAVGVAGRQLHRALRRGLRGGVVAETEVMLGLARQGEALLLRRRQRARERLRQRRQRQPAQRPVGGRGRRRGHGGGGVARQLHDGVSRGIVRSDGQRRLRRVERRRVVLQVVLRGSHQGQALGVARIELHGPASVLERALLVAVDQPLSRAVLQRRRGVRLRGDPVVVVALRVEHQVPGAFIGRHDRRPDGAGRRHDLVVGRLQPRQQRLHPPRRVGILDGQLGHERLQPRLELGVAELADVGRRLLLGMAFQIVESDLLGGGARRQEMAEKGDDDVAMDRLVGRDRLDDGQHARDLAVFLLGLGFPASHLLRIYGVRIVLGGLGRSRGQGVHAVPLGHLAIVLGVGAAAGDEGGGQDGGAQKGHGGSVGGGPPFVKRPRARSAHRARP